MPYVLITTNGALEDLVSANLNADAVMVDTEFMRRDTYYPQAALIQLCFSSDPDTAWLVDPLAVSDFSPLADLFRNPSIVKALHSASEDLEVFQCFLNVQPMPFFDTQRAAAFAGLGFSLGYRALVEKVTGDVLDKGETRSDWLRRPLTDSQLAYAAADVVPLLPVYRHLRHCLDASERGAWVFEDSAQAVADAQQPPASSYLRVKSAWKLNARQLATLAVICNWRDERARRLDKPKSWILADKLCFALAEQPPANMAELRGIADMPAAVVRKQGEVLLDLVAEALTIDEADLPEPLGRPLDAAQRDLMKKLKQASARLARDWQVEPESLLPAKDYELLVREGAALRDAMPQRWQGWRKERLIEPLLQIVEGAA